MQAFFAAATSTGFVAVAGFVDADVAQAATAARDGFAFEHHANGHHRNHAENHGENDEKSGHVISHRSRPTGCFQVPHPNLPAY